MATRILHTADLHLADDRPERWEALEAVLRLGRERDVDALLVAGDLLDRGGDHAALRSRARNALEELDAPVLLLPGNHDRDAYRPGQDWGRRTRLLVREPVHATEVDGVRVVGVPYPEEPASFRSVRRSARRELDGEGTAVLALHGTLIDADAPHIQDESREEEPGDYFPVRTGELRGIGAAYVALGHYHQHDLRRAGRTLVAYAGSPSPVGAHALGPRSAVLVEVPASGGEVRAEAVRLPVPYRDRIRRWLTPFREEEELDALAEILSERSDGRCAMRVTLDGILAGIGEDELRRRLDDISEELGPRFRELDIRR
ncbi:MAG: exonuclease SbcCD subunit D, partial [Gemmatimonadota bacterium]